MSKIITFNQMVACIESHKLTLPQQDCNNYKKLFRLASALYCPAQSSSIRLFFLHPDSSETEIESDLDLMSLKYLVNNGNIIFRVQVSKSKEQIEKELVSESVSDYLTNTYEDIAEQQFQKEVGKSINKYLQSLYKKVAVREVKEKVKKIKKDEVSNYINSMARKVISQATEPKRIPTRQRRTKTMRVSPEKEIFKRKEGHIESMVGRILESMMPVMVKELSYRILEELKGERESYYYDSEMNPEDL